ncbi:MAG: EAL domain-containing protein [Ectothiorhodospiraceae bacterium]|nr:EAL domain-containing protein [Ectothiorhodospiraceae bacterium]
MSIYWINSTPNILKKIPVDTLKINRSFISPMVTSHDARELVRAIISMAHSFNLKVVAEGVENYHFLLNMGVIMLRGIYIADRLNSLR